MPYTTFPEIAPPEIKYVLRMKKGPAAALFLADIGEWRLTAMQRVKDFLDEKLKLLPDQSAIKVIY
jgi:hypothetical protein